MKFNQKLVLALFFIIGIGVLVVFFNNKGQSISSLSKGAEPISQVRKQVEVPSSKSAVIYDPVIKPSDFSTTITNKYFSWHIGKKMTYMGTTTDGVKRIEIEIESATRTIMGVETLVYRDRVYLGKELTEDTKDYLAQDKEGNVWYFGEEVKNFEKGKFKDQHGSWIAGENGALPGIWIKAKNTVGDSYRQEYLKGQAEDMTDVVAINQTIKTKEGTYNDCIKMYDWTPLDVEAKEYKYYCPKVAGLVISEKIQTGEKEELTNVIKP